MATARKTETAEERREQGELMAAVKKTTNEEVVATLKAMFAEIIGGLESGTMEFKGVTVENDYQEHTDGDHVRAVMTGRRHLTLEWYDPAFDGRREFAAKILLGLNFHMRESE